MNRISDINPRRGTAASLLRCLREHNADGLEIIRQRYAWSMTWDQLRHRGEVDDAANLVAHFRSVGAVRDVCAAMGCQMRRARFRLDCRLDGADGATVTIEGSNHPVFSVRPARRRRLYTLPLEEVATIVLERVAKAEAAAKAREKKARRAR